MRGMIGTFMGIDVIENSLIPEFRPTIELSNNVTVSDEFRKKCNAWYLEMFGQKRVMYMVSGKYIGHPNTIEMLVRQASRL